MLILINYKKVIDFKILIFINGKKINKNCIKNEKKKNW